MHLITQTERTTLEVFGKETAVGQLRWHRKTADKVEFEIEFVSFEYVAEGKSSKETAQLLGRSDRTIAVHRSHIMRKLGVDNLVDLVKRASMMGLVDFPPNARSRSRR